MLQKTIRQFCVFVFDCIPKNETTETAKSIESFMKVFSTLPVIFTHLIIAVKIPLHVFFRLSFTFWK